MFIANDATPECCDMGSAGCWRGFVSVDLAGVFLAARQLGDVILMDDPAITETELAARDIRRSRLYQESSSSKSSSSSSRTSGSRSCRVALAPLPGSAGTTAVKEYFPWTLMWLRMKGLRRATSSSRTG